MKVAWQLNMSTYIDEIPSLQYNTVEQMIGSQLFCTLTMQITSNLNINILNNSMITCLGFTKLVGGNVRASNYSSPALLQIQG